MMVAGVAAFLFAQRHLQGETFLMEKFGWPGFLRWLGGSLVCICLVSGLRWLWQGDPFDWKSALSVLEGFMLAYLIVTPIRIAFLNLVNG